MKLKTLENMGHIRDGMRFIKESELRQEAIKWIKEDKEILKYMILEDEIYDICNALVKIWMKRLDITEEDLKNET